MSDDRLIVALDVHTMDDVKALVSTLGDTVTYYKVGMELFYSVGPDVVRLLKEQGKHVFLDLKLHDIPNTVAGGLASLMGLGADIVNVHASGGYTMMKTAATKLHAAAAEQGIPCPKIIGVTVLTSMNEDDWKKLGETEPMADRVTRLAKLAKAASSRRRKKRPASAKPVATISSSSRPAFARQVPASTTRAASQRLRKPSRTAQPISSSAAPSGQPKIRKPRPLPS